ncbi:MAG: glycosyltransferase [Kiritimatiellia bacterium]|nr:glycosyltransferase [Kiritimatiellia bacterium]
MKSMELSAASGEGKACECGSCRIRILVARGSPPPVCPFCQATLRESGFRRPSAGPEPESDMDRGSARTGTRRFPKWAMLTISALSILLLAVAVIVKMQNVEYFWYQPWINIYSLTVGFFILSRFFLAAFYSAPPDVGYEPTVAVIVACRNEADSIEKTIHRIYAEGYPHAKLEVVVVNDGSTDNTLERMQVAQVRHPSLVVVDFAENKGKRHGMAVGALLAQSEILLYVDSDSFLLPGAIRKVVQGLADPTVAAVSGHTDVENVRVNMLTKMQDVRYFVSYRVMKAAESLFGAVSCCPGCFSAYRKVCVLNVLNQWLNQRFLGRYATFGDDRSLTNFLLRRYRVLYDDEALATTIVPEKWLKYAKQQARWKRSWLREMLCAGRFIWRKHPVAAISWYAMVVLPLLGPIVVFSALVIGPLLYHTPPGFYIGGVLVVSLLWSLYYLERTRRPHWWAGFLFTITYILFFSWQGYYALFTLRKTSWGTR